MSATNKKFHICDGGANDETLTNVDFGWSWDNRDGSGFAFRSVDFGNEGNTERGAFILWARDASNSYSLTGKCDGTLTWPGTIVSNGINHISTSNYYAVKVVSPATNVHFGFDWASYNGGGVYFRGSDYNTSAEKGNFTLYASKTDGTTNNRSTLTGTPDGVLTWTGTAKISGDHGAAPSSGGLTITGGKQNFAIQVQTNGVTKGTAPSAVVYNGIEFYGNTMTKYQNRLGILEQSVSTANVSSITMSAYGCAAAETTTNCAISCNVDASGNVYTSAPTPAQTDDSTKIATTAYVKDCVPKSIGSAGTPVYSNANGVITACTVKNNTAAGACGWSSSTGDGLYLTNINTLAYWNGCYSGTSSNLAYCNKGAFGDMATKTASNYVATSGNQTIAGNKTFSGQVILTKNTGVSYTAANAVALIVGGAQTAQHLEFDANEITSKTNGTTVGTLYVGGGNGSVYFSTSATAPNTTNVITLGASGKVWKQLYAGTTTISTSDERQKQQIEDIPDEVLDIWGEVEFKQFKFDASVEEKGSENARIHMGVIAQQIKKVFEKHNLDPFKYGFFCYDEWDVHEDPKDENSPIIRRENSYAIRYEELLIIEAAYQRRRLDRIEEAIKLLSK